MKIGFIGLGRMGAAIATNLVRARHEVTVWNRSPDKARALVDAGATLAARPKEAAAGREIVVSMLADDAALDSVMSGDGGILAGLHAGALHISMSTIAVATADNLGARHAERGQRFLVDCNSHL
jgi:3-hydroxyisobutyrate dehydrogenase-like beta-hydroxyacid dehydrogenase